VVRDNERGPYVDNRLIDLSRAAAEKIGMLGPGTALVEVRAVGPPNATLPTVAASNDLYIQAGAFSDPGNAERLVARLRAAGLGPAFVRKQQVNGRTLYRVRLGSVPSVAEFDRMIEELKGVGITDAHL